MTNLQFALFFVAILVGYVLVHLRLVKFETYLKEIAGLKQLNDRLSSVAEAMDRIKIDNLEEGLTLLHEDAKELSAAVARVERGLSGLNGNGEEKASALTSGGSVAERVCTAIQERLFQLGFQQPRILTDLHNLHLEDEIEVQVECERQMMPYKGKVKTRNGAVLDVDVHSVVTMFP